MRVLVISDCATREYVEIVRRIEPRWMVRGVLESQAGEWLAAGRKAGLRRYASTIDVLLGVPGSAIERLAADVLPAHSIKIDIPRFDFWGLHPDCFLRPLAGERPLHRGALQSRLVLTALALGCELETTVGLFREEVYQELGFFDQMALERERLLARFAAFGIGLEERFEEWIAAGSFLYTPNHAHSFVYFDLLLAACSPRVELDLGRAARVRSGALPNTLAHGLRWPVYPEIARRYGLGAEPLLWHTAAGGAGRLDLHRFVARCSDCLRGIGPAPEEIPGGAAIAELIRSGSASRRAGVGDDQTPEGGRRSRSSVATRASIGPSTTT